MSRSKSKSGLPKELAAKAAAQQAVERKPFVLIEVKAMKSGQEATLRPRPMTRDEMRAFRAADMDPALWATKRAAAIAGAANEEEAARAIMAQAIDDTAQQTAAMVDWILDNIYAEYNFSGTPYPDCVELAGQTYRLTMGAKPDELKNS